jgi:hypothetical protein
LPSLNKNTLNLNEYPMKWNEFIKTWSNINKDVKAILFFEIYW